MHYQHANKFHLLQLPKKADWNGQTRLSPLGAFSDFSSQFQPEPETTKIWRLLAQIGDDQHPGWGGGQMTPSTYDTAWVARVPAPYDQQKLAFPASFEWLLSHQAKDGSWSGGGDNKDRFPYTLVPTLAAFVALLKAPAAYQTETVQTASRQAHHYLQRWLPRWEIDRYESIGFEIIVPALLSELALMGYHFSFEGGSAHAQLMKLYHEKLLIAGPQLLYSGQSNLLFTLEGFGAAGLDWERLKSQQAPTGSYGASPAATAAALIYGGWDEQAATFLAHLTERAFGGERGAMPNAIIDNFEASWTTYNLLTHLPRSASATYQQPFRSRVLSWLKASLNEREGASYSRFSAVPMDSDDTGVVLAALALLGEAPSLNALKHFERDNYFACFERERGTSLSANAHVLAALAESRLHSKPAGALACQSAEAETEWQNQAMRKTVKYLYELQESEGYWQDKWHSSPYYATASSVLALSAATFSEASGQQVKSSCDARLVRALDWVVETQSWLDGGWGGSFADGAASNLEESAYALQILQALEPVARATSDRFYDQTLERGLHYLSAQTALYEAATYPESLSSEPKAKVIWPNLWLGKVLYCPSRVVYSAALGVLNRANYYNNSHQHSQPQTQVAPVVAGTLKKEPEAVDLTPVIKQIGFTLPVISERANNSHNTIHSTEKLTVGVFETAPAVHFGFSGDTSKLVANTPNAHNGGSARSLQVLSTSSKSGPHNDLAEDAVVLSSFKTEVTTTTGSDD